MYNKMTSDYIPVAELEALTLSGKGKLSLAEANFTNTHALQIILTNKCNLWCKDCFRGCNKKVNLWEYTFEEYEHDLNVLMAHGINRFSLQGGEVYLCRDFKKILKYTLECNTSTVGIITNGKYITHDPELINLFRHPKLYMQFTPYSDVDYNKFIKWADSYGLNIMNNSTPCLNSGSELITPTFLKIYPDANKPVDGNYRKNNCCNCAIVTPGKLLACDIAMAYPEWVKDEYIDLNQEFTMSDVLHLLRDTQNMCKYCNYEVSGKR